jgi:hypothetical protein
VTREEKLKALGRYHEAWQVISWARELVDEWGSEVHSDDGERLDRLGVAVKNFEDWLDGAPEKTPRNALDELIAEYEAEESLMAPKEPKEK